MTQQRTQPTQVPYLFEHVFQKLCNRFWKNTVVPEITNMCKIYTIKTKPKSSEIFEVFPRSSNFYKQTICDLTTIAKSNNSICLHYLKNTIGEIVTGRKQKIFDKLNQDLPQELLAMEIVRSLELLLITDLICNIISNMDQIEQQTSLSLINCGIYLCMSPPTKDDFPNLLLKQWAVIFSRISLLRPSDIFETLTQLIINKYDYFFKLMKYVRLNVESKDSHSNDILEIMTSHVKRAKMKKCLTTSMLFSLSTILTTFQGQSPCIKQLLDIAIPLKKTDPGAVDLISTLLKYTGWDKDTIDKFYEDDVYTLTNSPDGILAAAHAFRVRMFGNNLDPDFLFYVWGPTQRNNTFAFLNWEVIEDVESLTKTFTDHYFESPYFNTSSSIFTEIIVRLAALNFDLFLSDILTKFVQKDIDSNQFKVFLNIVAMINDQQFVDISHVEPEKIRQFNEAFAKHTNAKMGDIIKTFDNFGISISDEYISKVNKESEAVEKINKGYGINIGKDTNTPYCQKFNQSKTTSQKKQDNSRRVVMIFPYIVNSSMFQTEEWMKSFTRLAAVSDEDVSKPAYSICQSFFDRVDQRQIFCKTLVEMAIEFNQQMEIFYVCIKLLIELTDYLEPKTPDDNTAIEYQIELVACLGLASDFPIIRVTGYDLLIRVNKLLQNQGLYSELEDQMPSVESSVNHNIIMQKFPKMPGSNVFFEEDLIIDHYLYSRYNEPWLFFLAEIGQLVYLYQFDALLFTLEKFSKYYADNIDEINRKPNHLSLGILVIFFSTCTVDIISSDQNNSDQLSKICQSYWRNVKTIIQSCFESKNELIFIALQHMNYTIAPLIFDVLKEILEKASDDSLTDIFIKLLPAIHLMQCSIDSSEQSKQKIIKPALEIYIIVCSHNQTMSYFYNMLTPEINPQPFVNNESITLSFINFLNFVMDSYDKDFDNEKKVHAAKLLWNYILKLMELPDNEDTKFLPIKTYVSNLLQTIVNKAITIIPLCNDTKIRVISNSEKYGYHVLYPLLKNKISEYFDIFVDSCFRRKGLMADEFFSAIYEVLFPTTNDNTENRKIFDKQSGVLLLLALFRVKMESPQATEFFQKFYAQCPFKSSQKRQDVSYADIMTNPVEYLGRLAEKYVKNALRQMKHERFKGTLEIMADLLIPWIKKFRLVPKNRVCIPTSVSQENYPPEEFLKDLMVVTKKYRTNHDFPKIIEIWYTLLKESENQYMAFPFITEYTSNFNDPLKKEIDRENHEIDDTDLKKELFSQLLQYKDLRANILKILTNRCKFSFYAYITYQQKKDMNDQFWVVDLLVYALKNYGEFITSRIPIILQFALLFHSDQTRYLMKQLAKRYKIEYNRRALSSILIAKMVTELKSKIEKEYRDLNRPPNKSNNKIGDVSIQTSSEGHEKPHSENELSKTSSKESDQIEFKELLDESSKTSEKHQKTQSEVSIKTSLKKKQSDEESSKTSEESKQIELKELLDESSSGNSQNNHKNEFESPYLVDAKSADIMKDSNKIAIQIPRTYTPGPRSPQILRKSSFPTSLQVPEVPSTLNNSSSIEQPRPVLEPLPSNSTTALQPSNNPQHWDLKPAASQPIIQMRPQSQDIPHISWITRKKPSVTRWAFEAIRWTIGSQQLRLAHMSLIILNALKPDLDDNAIMELLHGVCRSTAYFLYMTQESDDKSLLYDFIDETFELFGQHCTAVGNHTSFAELTFKYVSSFLKFNVQVDAYFEKMLPLFNQLLACPLTKEEMRKNLLQALRPCFNELEGDSKVRESFETFVEQFPQLDFVKIVLEKSEEYDKVIQDSDEVACNQALVHYSLMITNASADMKKRIFTISTKIIEKLQAKKKNDKAEIQTELTQESYEQVTDWPSQKSGSNKGDDNQKVKMGSHSFTDKEIHTNSNESGSMPILGNGDDPTKSDPKELKSGASDPKIAKNDTDDRDDSTQGLLVIFKAATESVPWMTEALDFIKAVSSFYPMIPGVVPINDVSWTYAANQVIKKIYFFLPKETILGSVIPVNCKKLNSISSLMLIPVIPTSISMPTDMGTEPTPPSSLLATTSFKVLPLNPMFEPSKPKTTNRFNSIMNKVCRLSQQFKDKVTCPVSPKIESISNQYWTELHPFEQFIPDDSLNQKSENANMFGTFNEFCESNKPLKEN